MARLVVVDFDGCLVRCNSFRGWLLYLPLVLLLSLRWHRLAGFGLAIARRLLGISDRIQMKKDIMRLSQNLPSRYFERFAQRLHRYDNQALLDALQAYRQGDYELVLCSAAPVFYLRPYASAGSFNRVLGSPDVPENVGSGREVPSEAAWRENYGQQKLNGLLASYADSPETVTIACVFTDHHDDLPLLQVSDRRVLVDPTDQTLQALEGMIDFERIQSAGR